MFEVFWHRVSRSLRCTWLGVRGQWLYRRGLARRDLTEARANFERLVSLQWTSFRGHLHLGLIAEHLGRRAGALEELAVAYRLDAARFRRAAIPKTLREQVLWRETLAPDRPLILGAGEPLGRDQRTPATTHPAVPEARRDVGRAVAAGTDFASDAEMRRFEGLPPILPEEVSATDVDELLQRLLDE